jgi:uncharacterized repeat protein (TIGR03803 family)
VAVCRRDPRDAAGNLYGTTVGGGTAGRGVVYELDAAGNQIVLYTFTGADDGGIPAGSVIRDVDGNLYGTTSDGGYKDRGVVYMLDTAGNEVVLHTFASAADGNSPSAGVTRDSAGNLYGTTYFGGGRKEGVVFKVTP